MYARHLLFRTGDLLLPVPYDVDAFPFLYELTAWLQSMTALIGFTKMFTSECVFFALLFHLKLCTDRFVVTSGDVWQLSVGCRPGRFVTATSGASGSVNAGASSERSTTVARFKNWIKIHQQIEGYV